MEAHTNILLKIRVAQGLPFSKSVWVQCLNVVLTRNLLCCFLINYLFMFNNMLQHIITENMKNMLKKMKEIEIERGRGRERKNNMLKKL